MNNPAIWRPVLSIQDTTAAYVRAIEASENISGIFNVASGNYTVGEVADLVKERLERDMDCHVKLKILNRQDYRNYKVSIEKAAKVLGFKPTHDIASIVDSLAANLDKFRDFDNPNYYNIEVFKKLCADLRPPMTRTAFELQ